MSTTASTDMVRIPLPELHDLALRVLRRQGAEAITTNRVAEAAGVLGLPEHHARLGKGSRDDIEILPRPGRGVGGLHGHIELGEYSFELGNGGNRALIGSGPGEAVKIDPDAHRPSRAALAERNGFGDMYSPAGWSEYCAAFA